jgi:mRNA interferase MazF
VVPITRNIDRLYPSEAFGTINGTQHTALADQLTTVSKRRLGNRMGRISRADLQAIEHAIKIQLGLS